MKKALLILTVVAAVIAVWQLRGDEREVARRQPRVFDRVWIDHVPNDERDPIHLFAVITKQPLGIFQTTSAWKGSYESFRYEAHGDELRLVYPQNGDRERVAVRARNCNEGPMELCLDIIGASRGVQRYYSRKGWEIDAGARPELIRQRMDEIAAGAGE